MEHSFANKPLRRAAAGQTPALRHTDAGRGVILSGRVVVQG